MPQQKKQNKQGKKMLAVLFTVGNGQRQNSRQVIMKYREAKKSTLKVGKRITNTTKFMIEDWEECCADESRRDKSLGKT